MVLLLIERDGGESGGRQTELTDITCAQCSPTHYTITCHHHITNSIIHTSSAQVPVERQKATAHLRD